MLKPLADRVIVKFEEEKEEKTVGGLILTTKAASSSYATATVVACGAGKVASTGTLIPMTVQHWNHCMTRRRRTLMREAIWP